MIDKIPLIIPSYHAEPDFPGLIEKFIAAGFTDIIVVRDGGDNTYDQTYAQAAAFPEVTLLTHAVNLGKGRALKTALNYIMNTRKDILGVATADADGQHLPEDVRACAETFLKNPHALILGCRAFDKDVPFRSDFGNTMTRHVFFLFTGCKVSDTQTGLRIIPAAFLPQLMRVRGEKYEFETNVLLLLNRLRVKFIEVIIKTVYIESNRSSHFNPILDSMKIYLIFARYSFSSLFSVVVDYVLFSLLFHFTAYLAFSIFSARIISLLVNYKLNRQFVFSNSNRSLKQFFKFVILCLFNVFAVYGILYLAEQNNLNVYWIKLGVEFVFFFMNFVLQRLFVFTNPEDSN